MLIGDVRNDIVQACRNMLADRLTVGTSGNISVRVGDVVAVTPSGVNYHRLTPQMIGVHRLDGTAVDAQLRPASELPLHLAVYRAIETSAIVHTHSTAATAVSTLVAEVPAIHYLTALFDGPIPVLPYETYGSPELARTAARALRARSGCLLGNHGAVTVGDDLASAYTRSVYLEWICDVYLRAASAGRPKLLTAAEMTEVTAKISTYGQSKNTEAPLTSRAADR
jgi:L-fuculose-phosphate aldolase